MTQARVTYVGGNKGGVGKSMVAMSVIDYLMDIGDPPMLIETDTGNPDVAKAYEQTVRTETVNLDDVDGWIDLANLMPEATTGLVINSAARSQKGLSSNWEILRAAAAELKKQITVIWVINRQRESVEALRDFADSVPETRIVVLKNTYFGAPEKFSIYDDSKTRKLIEANGGATIDFPELADRVADDIINRRLTISKAAEVMQIGNRIELGRWKKAVVEVLGKVYGI